MTPEQLKQRVRQIVVWKRGDQRAPHKPLLLLYALGRLVNSNQRRIPYSEVDRDLRLLLLEFGPERKSCHPEYPFWRLQNDGIWELSNADQAELRAGQTDAKKSELLKYGVYGGFTEEVYTLLVTQPRLISELAIEILSQHFPASIFGDILLAVGLEIEFEQSIRRKRDPAFRERILIAYQYRCAVCGYDVRIGNHHVALEAAHIKWHQAGGPDAETNGLALCSMHHKLFDRGAFTISDDLALCVSQKANGTSGLSEWLMAFHGRPLRESQSPTWRPSREYLNWHREEVFHGPFLCQ
ncbi:phosphorothioated DNA-binding restriction endonuclease [Schlesneria sp. T3-172]|uniref:phosphorothioated DNA-binding restriction endonuclease n=1 Tax=Schlesneria sphaerica TaxID=3373610 RepID=UPI0037C92662